MLTTQILHEISDVMKISTLAEKAGLNKNTILAKLRDKRDLTTTESQKLQKTILLLLDKVKDKEFRLEDYRHYTMAQILELPDEIQDKIMAASVEAAKDDYEYIPDYQHIIEH